MKVYTIETLISQYNLTKEEAEVFMQAWELSSTLSVCAYKTRRRAR